MTCVGCFRHILGVVCVPNLVGAIPMTRPCSSVLSFPSHRSLALFRSDDNIHYRCTLGVIVDEADSVAQCGAGLKLWRPYTLGTGHSAPCEGIDYDTPTQL